MLKLQNIYPFTKSKGLDKCFPPFIIYVHKQCDLHPFRERLQIILMHCLHLLHTGIYQNWSVRGCISFALYVIIHNIYNSDASAVFSALITQYYSIQSKWKQREKKMKIIHFCSVQWINFHNVIVYILYVFLLSETGGEMLDNKAYTSVLDKSMFFFFY